MTPSAIRPDIAALSAYHVQDAAGCIKLDAMENPFDFPDALKPGLAAALATASLNRYPDADAAALKRSVRRAFKVDDNLDILLGNGSDEIIQMIAMAVAKPNATLLSVEPSFVMFRMIATFCGMHHVGVPLTADFAIDRSATIAAIRNYRPAVTFIAYPNNPTGNLFDRAVIHDIIRAAGEINGLVVIDEAYFAFSSLSFIDEINQHANAVLMRTVSKLGLAGLRLGILAGHREWLSEIDKVRLPYNINALTQAAATFALDNAEHFTAQTEILKQQRSELALALDAMLAPFADARRIESEANFILIRLPDAHPADAVFAALKSAGILVKNTSHAHPLLANTLRITVGSAAENHAFCKALGHILNGTTP
jgi:histidinol-phosphate aminotransferase